MPSGGSEQRERVIDVVAIAHERDDDALEPAEALLDREQVRERLAGMLAKREPVDDRHARLGRELHGHLVRTRPDDDRIDHPLEVPRDVAHALPGAQHDVMGQVDRVAAKLDHAGLEADPRPQARLLEQHRERPARQGWHRVAPR